MAWEGDTTAFWCDPPRLGRTDSVEDLQRLQVITLTSVGVVGFLIIGFLLLCMFYKNERLLEKAPCRRKGRNVESDAAGVDDAIMTLVTSIPMAPSLRVAQLAPQDLQPTTHPLKHFPSHKTMLLDVASSSAAPSSVSRLSDVTTPSLVPLVLGGGYRNSCPLIPIGGSTIGGGPSATVGDRPIHMISTTSLYSARSVGSTSTACSDGTFLSISTEGEDWDTLAESRRGARGEKGHAFRTGSYPSDNYGSRMGARKKGTSADTVEATITMLPPEVSVMGGRFC